MDDESASSMMEATLVHYLSEACGLSVSNPIPSQACVHLQISLRESFSLPRKVKALPPNITRAKLAFDVMKTEDNAGPFNASRTMVQAKLVKEVQQRP